MELNEVLAERRSIRKFRPDPVPRAYIEEMLNAARLAPSAVNRQPWRFFVIENPEIRKALYSSGAVKQAFVSEAPVIIVICVDLEAYVRDTDKSLRQLIEVGALEEDVARVYAARKQSSAGGGWERMLASAYLDAGIAGEHIVLAATALGLGSCWVRMADLDAVGKIIGLPPNHVVVALLPVGFPAEHPPARPRKSVGEIAVYLDATRQDIR